MRIFGRKNNRKYEQAALLLADGNAPEAIYLLREIVEDNPDHTHALTTLAVALMEKQLDPDLTSPITEEAMKLLDQAAASDLKDPVPVFNKGVILRNLGHLEEALECFEAALEIEERLPLALLHMAEIYYEMEQWVKAVELARIALIRDPGIEGALKWVQEAMRKAGFLDEDGKVIEEKTPWYVEGDDGRVSYP